MVYTPPASFTDALDDSMRNEDRDPKFHPLEMAFGTFYARAPLPNAVGALGNAVNSKITPDEQLNYIGLFVQNHMEPASFDDLIYGMMTGDYPPDAVQEVSRAIATRGTSRPTGRSSTSRS